jgi:hypothetical protein
VFFVQRLNTPGFIRLALNTARAYKFPAPALRGGPVTDLGELMTTDSYRTGMRPLVLTVAWFAFLACTAFAWAAIESQPPAPQSPKPAVFVLKQ